MHLFGQLCLLPISQRRTEMERDVTRVPALIQWAEGRPSRCFLLRPTSLVLCYDSVSSPATVMKGSSPGLGEAGACYLQIITDPLHRAEHDEMVRMMMVTKDSPCPQGANGPRPLTPVGVQLQPLLAAFCQQQGSRGATSAALANNRAGLMSDGLSPTTGHGQPGPTRALSCLLSSSLKHGRYTRSESQASACHTLPAPSGQNLGSQLAAVISH